MEHKQQIVLLDGNFQFLNVISLRKALKLIAKNKVEILKHEDSYVHVGIFMPKVLRLFKTLAHVYGRRLQWSRHNIYTRDMFTCQYCGVKLPEAKATIDHVQPVSRGGKNTWENTVTSCYACNNSKADRTPEEANMKLRTKPRAPLLLDFFCQKLAGLGIEPSEIFT